MNDEREREMKKKHGLGNTKKKMAQQFELNFLEIRMRRTVARGTTIETMAKKRQRKKSLVNGRVK